MSDVLHRVANTHLVYKQKHKWTYDANEILKEQQKQQIVCVLFLSPTAASDKASHNNILV